MIDRDYFNELPMAVTICDKDGVILYMNKKSIATFASDGGEKLIGSSLLECHPPTAKTKLLQLLDSHESNTYTIDKNGKRKMIHQTPWFENGNFEGLIEFSIEIPKEMPHFVRS